MKCYGTFICSFLIGFFQIASLIKLGNACKIYFSFFLCECGGRPGLRL